MKKRGESGFALLLVFLMAAVVAITLYMQIPRIAFQSQRQKEQLLIERGEQYQRAIQLFFRTNNRYPGELKDLENFNHRRFLRHKFVDPITGKDDWRLVHINNGVLTDSVLNKKKPGDPNQQQADANANSYVGVQPSIGQQPNAQQNVNPALARRRPSEGGPAAPAIGPDGQPLPPGQPGTGTPLPGEPSPGQPQAQPYPGFPGTAVAPFPGGQVPGQVQNPGFPGVPSFPGQVPSRTPGVPSQSNPGAQPGQTYPGQVQAQPFPGAQPTPFGGQPNPNAPGGYNPITQLPGRVGGFQAPGAQPAPTQPPTSSYVGSGGSYVGSSQPYVGGGSYVGSQTGQPPTPPSTIPPNPGNFNPGNFNPGNFNPGNNNPVTTNPGNYTPGNPNPVRTNPVNPLPFATPNFPTTQTAPPSANPATPGFGQSPAPGIIAPLLGTPNPAANPALANGQPTGQQIGGGIAGVASKSEDPAIMVYNDRTNYNEWEFIFDPTKQQGLAGLTGGSTIGTPAANLGTPASALGTPAGVAQPGLTPVSAGASPFGGPASAFGAAPTSPLGGTSPFGAASPFGGTSPGSNPTSPAGPGASLIPGAPGLPGAQQGKQPLPNNLRLGRP